MLLLGCFTLYRNKVNATIKLVAWMVQADLLDMVTKIQCCCKYQRVTFGSSGTISMLLSVSIWIVVVVMLHMVAWIQFCCYYKWVACCYVAQIHY